MLKRRIVLPLFVMFVGAGLGLWAVATPAHGTAIAITPLTITKIASDGDHFLPGNNAYYQITVHNPNDFTVYLNNITDTLPAGFTYNAGSYGGLATFDPDIVGQTLTWAFDGENVGGLADATLTFSATVSQTTGMYCNIASVDWGTGTASTGPTAAVQVLNEGDSQLTPTCGQPVTVRSATPTVTVTAPPTATEVPATSTPMPPTAAATATKPAGGSAGVIAAPNTGTGSDGGSPSTLLLAIAGAMVVAGAGAAAIGAKRR